MHHHLRRILKGAIFGALLGLAVGTGLAGVVLLLALPGELPMDRWYTGVAVFTLLVSSGTVVGLVVGLASKVPEHGLSFLQSTTIVAIGGVLAIVLGPHIKSETFPLGPLVGVVFGGIAAVGAGIARTHRIRLTKQKRENNASKA
jgi:peptidoglycan/LPS O-acetylase OafA/YrhL